MQPKSAVKTVFLIRHTQTVWNTLSRYQGRLDTDLSETGEAQVSLIADAVDPRAFQSVYCSPLKRARCLAEALSAKVGCPLVSDERITEIAMGPWEGLTRTEIEERFGGMLEAWHFRPDTVEFPGGETIFQVADRVRSFMEEQFVDGAPDSVAVVSHDAVVKVALMLSMGLELRHLHRFRMLNGSVSVLRGRSFTGSVESIDVTSHLTGSPFRVP